MRMAAANVAAGSTLSPTASAHLFQRDGAVERVVVTLGAGGR